MALSGIITSGSILIVLIILSLRFRKELIVTVTRMVYGPYSYEFFHIYKKKFIRSPYQYCYRDEFIAHLLFVISKKDEIPTFTSSKEIYFENTPYFIDYYDFLKKKGKPYCLNIYSFNQPDFIVKAIGYQATITGIKAIIVFYFLNDSFFMGEYIFKNPKNDIKEGLIDYFLERSDIPPDNFYIENTGDRIIHYQNSGFTVDIKYLSLEDKDITDSLNQYYNKVTSKKLVTEP